MVKAHEIVAQGCNPLRLVRDVRFGSVEEGICLEVRAPEACGSSVLEYELVAVCLDAAVLSGRAVAGVEEAHVDRPLVPNERLRMPIAAIVVPVALVDRGQHDPALGKLNAHPHRPAARRHVFADEVTPDDVPL